MRYVWIVFSLLVLAGCASTPVYNPMQASTHPVLLLNENSLKEVKEGMTPEEVHKIMGQELVIGYTYQSTDYKPLTILNPYKVQEIKGSGHMIEYYVSSIRKSDGVVSDDELMPLVYKDGKLIGRGWPMVKSLPGAQPVS
ncbi:MAG: hypothetical protein HQL14_07470 [Candidatus Omnitrophica bacterium]|nr:hypothetical protein [Candidatus Omnitrophota bacterium]